MERTEELTSWDNNASAAWLLKNLRRLDGDKKLSEILEILQCLLPWLRRKIYHLAVFGSCKECVAALNVSSIFTSQKMQSGGMWYILRVKNLKSCNVRTY